MEGRLRGTPKQFAVLVEFMERHGDIGRPQLGLQGRLRGDRLWLQLTRLLNSMGTGVKKPVHKWKKVWADWKTKTKKKYLTIRQGGLSADDRLYSRNKLTDLEDRVVAVLRLAAAGQTVAAVSKHEPGLDESDNEVCVESPAITPSSNRQQSPPATDPLTLSPRSMIGFAPEQSVPRRTQALIPGPHKLSPRSSSPESRTLSPGPASGPLTPSPGPDPGPLTPDPAPRSQSYRNQRQATSTNPRYARRYSVRTAFNREASAFVDIELRRLRLEETRERNLHQREMERLRLESQRIEATQELNRLLQHLGVIAQRLIDVLPRRNL